MTKEHYITTKGHFRTMCSCNKLILHISHTFMGFILLIILLF